jgi:hypothetical protein
MEVRFEMLSGPKHVPYKLYHNILNFCRKHECTQVIGPKHGESTYNYENNWQR